MRQNLWNFLTFWHELSNTSSVMLLSVMRIRIWWFFKPLDQYAEFINPDWEDKVNFGIGLSCSGRTESPGYLAGGPVRQPYGGVNFIPQTGIYEFGYWIRDKSFIRSRRFPQPYFWGLCNVFGLNCKLAQILFCACFKMFNFVKFAAPEKKQANNFFKPYFGFWIQYPVWIKTLIREKHPDQQHWKLLISALCTEWKYFPSCWKQTSTRSHKSDKKGH